MGRIKDWKRRYGVAGLCCRVVLWLLSKVGLDVRPWVLYRKQLTTEGSRSALPFCELTLADFESQTALNPDWFSGQKMDDMRKAFTVSGNHAYGLFEGDLLVCYGWVSLEQWGLEPRRRAMPISGTPIRIRTIGDEGSTRPWPSGAAVLHYSTAAPRPT